MSLLEIALGILGLLGLVVVLWWLIGRSSDLNEEEAAGLVAGNWPRIEDELDPDA